MHKCTKNKFTIKQFREQYSNDEACLDKIFGLTYGSMNHCPDCGNNKPYKRVSNRRCYQCTKCYKQIYPTAGTIFEKTRTPLTYWFFTIFLFTVSKNGLSACELQRHLGVTYKTAFRMLQQIRKLISNDEGILSGIVECDETYVGGKNKNRHWDKKVKNSQGRAFIDKAPVFGMIERGGRVIAYHVPDVKSSTIKPIIFDKVKVGSSLMTDEFNIYRGLGSRYRHEICDHGKGQYTNGSASTNCMENMWSNLKRTINGSYIHVSKKHLQLYINEAVFRYNNRGKEDMFNELLMCLSS